MSLPYRYPSPPSAPAPSAPPVSRMAIELGGFRDFVRLGLSGFRPRPLVRPSGETVILIPGWKAPEASMAPMRNYLRSLGVDARHWGLGTNQGDPERDREIMLGRISDLVAELGKPVVLVGWSLGGVIAREIAREEPELVSRVITYGTPVIGGPSYTTAARAFGREECERITQLSEELDRDDPIQVPISAIFTRRDGIVEWSACIDRNSSQVTHFEVGSTHLSMGFDPDVWRIVASEIGLAKTQ